VVRRRIGAAEVEDVVQSVLLEAVSTDRLPHEDQEVRRFVLAIARQKVADFYRRRRREPAVTPDTDEVAAPAADCSDLLQWASRALPTDRAAQETFQWMLREGTGESLAEIAGNERLPAPLVRQRVSRLRRYLRSVWRKELGIVCVLLLVLGLRHLTAPAPVAIRADPLAGQATFDYHAATVALSDVSLASCSSDPRGSSGNHAFFTFANDGSVAAVRIDAGPIASEPAAACVAERFSRIHVPPFGGPAVTLGRTFRVPAPGEGGCAIPYLVDAKGTQYLKADCH